MGFVLVGEWGTDGTDGIDGEGGCWCGRPVDGLSLSRPWGIDDPCGTGIDSWRALN